MIAPFLKTASKSVLYNGAAEWLVRRSFPGGVRVLHYHRFSDAVLLESHCRHFRKHYAPIPLEQYIDALHSQRPLPAQSLVVTIDDGYHDILTVAAPVFERYGIPVMVYLVSGFVDRQCWLWWDALSFAFANTAKSEVRIEIPGGPRAHLALGNAGHRQAVASETAVALARTASPSHEPWIADLCRQLDVRLPAEPSQPFSALTWDQIRGLQTRGFSFGAHTVHHPILGTLTSRGEKSSEIAGSRRRIEDELQKPVMHFAYPNGGFGDYDRVDLDILREQGFRSAVTTLGGIGNGKREDPLQLPRIGLDGTQGAFFRMKLAGHWRFQWGGNMPMRLNSPLLSSASGDR